jgi:hypothetical protein
MSVVETGFFTFKNMQIKRWSELRMQILSLARTKKQLRCEAALYSYLVPCYLTALTECSNAEAKGAVFYCRVLVQLLNKIESMLDEDQNKADKSKQVPNTSDVKEALIQLWILQNKVPFGFHQCNILLYSAITHCKCFLIQSALIHILLI